MHTLFLVIMFVLNPPDLISCVLVTSVHHVHASEEHHHTHNDYHDAGNNFASLITRVAPLHLRPLFRFLLILIPMIRINGNCIAFQMLSINICIFHSITRFHLNSAATAT